MSDEQSAEIGQGYGPLDLTIPGATTGGTPVPTDEGDTNSDAYSSAGAGGVVVEVKDTAVSYVIAGFTHEDKAFRNVEFTNTTLGPALYYSWDFGTGYTSSEKNPVYRFPSVGTFLVTLTVTGEHRTTSKTEEYITITELTPAASFIYEVGGFTVYLNDTSNIIGSTYLWSFGDSATSSSKDPEHTYSTNGDFDVTLLVNGTYSTTTTITIDTGILLSWSDNSSDETGFKVEHALSSGGPWTQIATTGAGVNSLTVTEAGHGVDSSVDNYFRVRAYNGNGNSDYSNTIHVKCEV
jgi:PKD repeat protein